MVSDARPTSRKPGTARPKPKSDELADPAFEHLRRPGQGKEPAGSDREDRSRPKRGRGAAPERDGGVPERGRGQGRRPDSSPRPVGTPEARTDRARESLGQGRRHLPVRVRFENLRPLYDYWGNEIRRYYQLETLAASTDAMIRRGDRFIQPSLRRIMGASPITHMRFSLYQEGYFQLIFRLTATNANRTEATVAFVVAKRAGETSTIAESEHRLLHTLHKRSPEDVVRPLEGGRIMLLGGRRGHEKPRFVYAYITQWADGFRELGVDRDLRFFVNAVPHQPFTAEQTEQLKARLVALIARTYDPVRRECMEMPQIASGDIVVGKTAKQSAPKLKLIACRRMLRNVPPARFLHILASAQWEWGGGLLRLMPSDPALSWAALTDAVGSATAREWAAAYLGAVAAGRYPERATLPAAYLGRVAKR